MPKQRTHSGTKKRFRVTRTGKVLHESQNRNHNFEKKASKRKRRLRRGGELSGGDAAQVKRLLTGR
jgi:large subunit ribosomal protein L35